MPSDLYTVVNSMQSGTLDPCTDHLKCRFLLMIQRIYIHDIQMQWERSSFCEHFELQAKDTAICCLVANC